MSQPPSPSFTASGIRPAGLFVRPIKDRCLADGQWFPRRELDGTAGQVYQTSVRTEFDYTITGTFCPAVDAEHSYAGSVPQLHPRTIVLSAPLCEKYEIHMP
jgi:hypothetical protein